MTMSVSISIGRSLSAIAAIPIAAIWIGEVRCDAKRLIEHALRLRTTLLFGCAAVSRKVFVQRCPNDLGQRASVVRTQLLDLLALFCRQVDLGTSCRSHIQRSIQHPMGQTPCGTERRLPDGMPTREVRRSSVR